MSILLLRIFLFTMLPLIIAGAQIWLDKSSRNRVRKNEVVLMYLFGLGVAGYRSSPRFVANPDQ